MFGYVTINQPEMKFKDYDMYRSFYCGLCRRLKESYGSAGQMTLTYDLTLRDPAKEKEMLDLLRCRNGNLEITVSHQETKTGEL